MSSIFKSILIIILVSQFAGCSIFDPVATQSTVFFYDNKLNSLYNEKAFIEEKLVALDTLVEMASKNENSQDVFRAKAKILCYEKELSRIDRLIAFYVKGKEKAVYDISMREL